MNLLALFARALRDRIVVAQRDTHAQAWAHSQLDAAAHWPRFHELTPTIRALMLADDRLSLEDAYLAADDRATPKQV